MNPRTRYVRLAGLLLALAALVNSAASQQIAQQAYLKASNTGVEDEFGQAVAVSGDTMVVGAPFESSNATGVNGNQNNNSSSWAGAAYVFVRNGTNWIQQAYLKASNTGAFDNFGYPVAVSGDTIVVGAVGESSSATGLGGDQSDNSASQSGAAYVFVRSGTNWIQQAYLKASNTKAGDQFGSSVAVSGDTVVVGAYFEDSSATGVDGDQSDTSAPNSGAAYVFVRNGASWTQQAYLKASNTDARDSFGTSVAVAGDTVVVGARAESSNATGVDGDQNDNSAFLAGAAYVFVRHGTAWTQQAYLKASATGASEYFGESVSVAGDTVMVGKAGGYAVAAYVFVRSEAIWTQQAYLKAYDTAGNAYFGISVAVSGDTVVVGAQSESSNATGVNGNQTNLSAPYSGAAYVFLRAGTNWSQQAYLKASNTGGALPGEYVGDWFGTSVAVSGDTVVVGAPFEDSSARGVNGNQSNNYALDSGAAYTFTGLGKVPPRLAIAPSGVILELSWPTNATGFVLQSATTLANGGDWQDSLLSATETNGQKVVPLTPTGARGFFRLRGP